MIITKLRGGLGNQMFQYALGRYLAFKNGTELRLDLADLSDRKNAVNYTNRTYELDVFHINAQISTVKDISSFYANGTLLDKTIKKLTKLTGDRKVVCEIDKKFHPSVLEQNKSIYLSGYWQSEKYFLPIRSLIAKDFTLKTELLNEIDQNIDLSEYKKLINSTDSVSIHFRRGDYVSDSATSLTHGTCPEDYYIRAIAQINKKISNPFFFLFSDDTEWIEKNFTPDIRYTIVKTGAGYIDLHLMSLCRHNIIANSSFSWWGAWLNNNPDKIVIAPRKWFANDNLNNQTVDLIPAEWIRM